MRLNKEEYAKYLEIHLRLIYYVGKKKNLIPGKTSLDMFLNYPVEEKIPSRNAVYDNIHLLDEYIKENSGDLSGDDKDIIRDFKYFKQGNFYVVKLTKKYAMFLGDKYVYGVQALNDPFETFWGNNLPVMVQAVLLPYKGKIIYDGILANYAVRFGSGIRKSIKNDYALSEGKYGIITELPEKVDKSKLENSVEKELLIMMKTKSSRDHNWYEIENLLDEHPELESIYIKEWGRINSRKKKKELKGLGIKKRWFALYDDAIIVSGQSEKEVIEEIRELIPDTKKREGVFYFKI